MTDAVRWSLGNWACYDAREAEEPENLEMTAVTHFRINADATATEPISSGPAYGLAAGGDIA